MPSSDLGVKDGDDPPTCKRCGESYVIECGYEPSKHGFCWPCCDEIVEKLFAILSDRLACRHIGVDASYRTQRAVAVDPSTTHAVLDEFLKRGTAKSE